MVFLTLSVGEVVKMPWLLSLCKNGAKEKGHTRYTSMRSYGALSGFQHKERRPNDFTQAEKLDAPEGQALAHVGGGEVVDAAHARLQATGQQGQQQQQQCRHQRR